MYLGYVLSQVMVTATFSLCDGVVFSFLSIFTVVELQSAYHNELFSCCFPNCSEYHVKEITYGVYALLFAG